MEISNDEYYLLAIILVSLIFACAMISFGNQIKEQQPEINRSCLFVTHDGIESYCVVNGSENYESNSR